MSSLHFSAVRLTSIFVKAFLRSLIQVSLKDFFYSLFYRSLVLVSLVGLFYRVLPHVSSSISFCYELLLSATFKVSFTDLLDRFLFKSLL